MIAQRVVAPAGRVRSNLARLFVNGERGDYWDPRLGTFEGPTLQTPASLDGVVGGLSGRATATAAIQSTAANMPYLRQTPETGKYWLDADGTDALVATFPSALGSTCTIARLDPKLGVVWSENQTVGTTFNVVTPFRYNGPAFLINRAMSATEKSVVEQVMLREMPSNWGRFLHLAATITSGTVADLTITTSDGSPYSVAWGDGGVSTNVASGVAATRTYSSTSSTPVVVTSTGTITGIDTTSAGWSFNVEMLPISLTRLSVLGSNTLSGSVAGLTGLTYLSVLGSNTLSGSVAGLTGLTYLRAAGNNTLSGSVTGLTGLTILSALGNNTLSGSIAGLTGLTQLNVQGNNTLSGSIAGLTGLTYLLAQGSNTLSGSVSGLTGLTTLSVAGSNTLSGSVTGLTKLTYLNVTGSNTLSGSVSGLTGLTYLRVLGSNTVSFPSSTSTITVPFRTAQITRTGSTLPSNEVDNLLISLAPLTWITEKSIVLGEGTAPRTSASDAAVATLVGNGVTVSTRP